MVLAFYQPPFEKKVQRSHFFPVMNLAWPRKSPGYGLQCWLVPSWLCLPSEDINVVGPQYDVLGWPRVSLVIKSLVMPLTALFWLSSRLTQSLENDKTIQEKVTIIFSIGKSFSLYMKGTRKSMNKKSCNTASFLTKHLFSPKLHKNT